VTQKLLKIAGSILGMGVAFSLTVLALNNPGPETYARLLTTQLETLSADPLTSRLIHQFATGLPAYLQTHAVRTNWLFFSVYQMPSGNSTLAIMHSVIPEDAITASGFSASSSSPTTIRDHHIFVHVHTPHGQTVAIPLYGTQTEYGYNPSSLVRLPHGPIPTLTAPIPAALAADIAAYWTNAGYGHGTVPQGYLWLGPRGWHESGSVLGADGSLSLQLQSSSNSHAFFTLNSDGACEGCMYTSIASVFPSLRHQVIQEEKWAFGAGFTSGPSPHYRTVQWITANIEAYSLPTTNPSNMTFGLAFEQMIKGQPNDFSNVSVTLPRTQVAVAATLLAAYVRPHQTSLLPSV